MIRTYAIAAILAREPGESILPWSRATCGAAAQRRPLPEENGKKCFFRETTVRIAGSARRFTVKMLYVRAFQASTVFFSSMAMVMGPTPPGTGVMAAACGSMLS